MRVLNVMRNLTLASNLTMLNWNRNPVVANVSQPNPTGVLDSRAAEKHVLLDFPLELNIVKVG